MCAFRSLPCTVVLTRMVLRHGLRTVLSHAALQFDTLERLAKKRRLEDAEMAVMQVPAPVLRGLNAYLM